MSVAFRYPSSGTLSLAAIGTNGAPIPTSSILIAGDSGAGNLTPLSVDASGNLNVNVLSLSPISGTVTANQGTAAALGSAWPVKLTDGSLVNTFTANGLKVDGSAVTQPVSAASLPLPTGASTSANQLTISGQLPATLGQKAMAASLAIAIASDQSAFPVTIASLPLPTGAATASNQTDGSQKTQIVDGSGNVIASTSNALNTSAVQSGTWNINNISGTISLPTGAATAGNQTTANTSLSTIATNTTGLNATIAATSSGVPADAIQIGVKNGSNLVPITEGQATMANSLPVAIASNQSAIPVSGNLGPSTGRAQANVPVRNDYSSVNVTTGAFVQLIASTTSTANMIEIFDSSGQVLAIATGAAASEVIQFYIYPGGNGQIPFAIASGTRVSIKAISASATSGQLVMNLYT